MTDGLSEVSQSTISGGQPVDTIGLLNSRVVTGQELDGGNVAQNDPGGDRETDEVGDGKYV